MSKYTIIKLKDLSPLHMGTGKENYDFSASQLHSDTLSAALAAMKAKYKGTNTNDLYKFLDSFTISSAFPYVGDHLFLPRPLGKMNMEVTDCDEYISRKKMKKVKFIEMGLWQEMIAGKMVQVNRNQLKETFVLDKDNQDEKFYKPYKSCVHQRVVVPRDEDKDTEPFFFDWTFFHKDAGLYCLVDAEEDTLNELVELFELLGEHGIGTDKSVGGGKFTVEKKEVEFTTIANSSAQMLLSLYIPSKEDVNAIDLQNSTYELCLRGGYMAGSDVPEFWHLRKKSIYMFNVGSVFSTKETLVGKIVELQPSYNDSRMHPVYRSGKPFVIPVNL